MYDVLIRRAEYEEFDDVKRLLADNDLTLEDAEYTAIAKLNEDIIGTCSFSGKIIKCFAVREDYKGEGLSLKLVTHIIDEMFERGIYEYFVFTKPENINIFKSMGFKIVHSAYKVCLLEGGKSDINKSIDEMFKKSGLGYEKKSALVMNCNPFTLGHRYIIEKASKESESVVVFIVKEDKSVFPFDIRYSLVKEGVSDLKNVKVISGGDYIISSATFPSYFIKQLDDRIDAYTNLDAHIFGKYIAPVFNIVKRYVGTEPFCKVTEKYNNALLKILPSYNVEVELVERIKNSGNIVSASFVRNLIKKGDFNSIRNFIPDVTFNYLVSEKAKGVIERIENEK
ncbi:[citrate (pro-3S)-lyase] ligase [Caloramator quimbayensis]|uniref:[Citrate [pro-3S]-lyase] ligase n=1 Tax=Caloramator quimbayensis TaxID=1147123 RepID=A0A1T4XLG2_9CLOT|nr:[citrate (pro-3S)-lyase] ligase [Caloramator quimbayensis]SKA90377.1 [citrate (pro-3S)-lyase] ligase [Caloramator quimbayensis]